MISIPTPYQTLAEVLHGKHENVRYVVCTGGRGSGKSFGVNTLLCDLLLRENHGILFTRYTLKSADDSIIPEFKDKIEKLGAESIANITKNDIEFTHNNSVIKFRGIKTSSGNQTAKLKSLKGVNIFVLEEAEESHNEEEFDTLDLSFRDKDKINIILLVLNPTNKDHWIYTRFFESKGITGGFNGIVGNVAYIHTDYRDNFKNLSNSFIQNIEEIKRTNPSKYKHKVLGGWIERAEGVIYNNWEYGKFEESTLHGFGLDFGFSIDPTALVEVSISKKKKVIYVRLHTYKLSLTTDQISTELNICKDKLIVADSAEPRLIKELKNKGHNIKACKKGAGSITGGIDVIRNYKLIVDSESTDIGKELNNYIWHDKKSSTPIDDYNHALDALRYICTDLLNKKKTYSYA